MSERHTLTSNLLGSIRCETLTLNSGLTKNDGMTVEMKAASETEFTSASCAANGEFVTITKVNITKFFSTGSSHNGTLSFTMQTDFSKISCTYTGTNVPFTYSAGGNKIVFSKAGGISGSTGCGSATLDATFLLEIGSTAVILD